MSNKHTMKTGLVIAIISISVLFGFTNLSRAEVITENIDDDTTFCITGGAPTSACSSGFGSTNLWQDILTPVFDNASPNIVTITGASFFSEGTNGAGTATSTLRILNAAFDVLAEGTIVGGSGFFNPGWIEHTFDTPLIQVPSTLASNTPAFLFHEYEHDNLTIRKSLTANNYGQPHYGTFNSTSTGQFAEFYNLRHGPTLDFFSATESITRQMYFRLISSATTLTIDIPVQGSTINTPVTVSGRCNDGVDLALFNGLQSSTSTQLFGTSALCTADLYTWPIGLLDGGNWIITASSSGAFATTSFFFLAQSVEDPGAVDSFFTDIEGGDSGFWDFIYSRTNQYIQLRPYSYLSDLYFEFRTQLENPTTTNPFPDLDTTIVAGGTTTTFDFAPIEISDVYDVLPADDWATLRVTFNLVIYIGFLFYVWKRIKKLV